MGYSLPFYKETDNGLINQYDAAFPRIQVFCLFFNWRIIALQYCVAAVLLLSRFSRVRLCATPYMAAHQAPPSLGFSRQEHWSGLPFPSPMHESEVAQSCPTLSDPMDCSPPGSSVHGILQARVLEWGAIAFFACPPSPKLNNPGCFVI